MIVEMPKIGEDHAGDIAADAEEDVVAERDVAGVAAEDVPARRHRHVHHHVEQHVQEVVVAAGELQRRHGEEHASSASGSQVGRSASRVPARPAIVVLAGLQDVADVETRRHLSSPRSCRRTGPAAGPAG